jgi:ABC-type multidrug transport system fused ATPase/permease subunit
MEYSTGMSLQGAKAPQPYGIRDAFQLLDSRDKRKLFFSSLIQIVLSLFDLLSIALVGLLVSLASSSEDTKQSSYTSNLLQLANIESFSFQKQIITIGCVSALLIGFKSAATVFLLRKNAFFLSRRSAEISKQLVSKLLSSSIIDLQVTSMQRSLFAVTTGVNTVTLGVIARCMGVIVDTATLITVLIGLSVLDSSIAIASSLIFGTMGLLLYKFIRKSAKRAGTLATELHIRSNQEVYEVLGSFREIKVKNRGHFFAEKIGNSRLLHSGIQTRISMMNVYSKYIMDSSVTAGALIVAMFQLYFLGRTEAIASLGLFLAAGLRLAPAVLRLQNNLIEMKISLSGAQDTLELNSRLSKYRLSISSTQTESHEYFGFNPTVEVKDVSFMYEDNELPTIQGVNFSISAGIFCGIVGQSGAGKSTLVDIMLGVMEPKGGCILISGLAPSQVIAKWPGAIGYVPQEVQIIEGTIKENIAMGYSDDMFHESLVWDAVATSNLDDFVKAQPLGIDSLVGDRGSKLSGGQKQRIGIARAMFTKPRLLILDEATSALDAETEMEFMESLKQLRGKVTIVAISHKPSTIQAADVVFEINGGLLREIKIS